MKKLTILLIMLITLLGCELEPEYEDYESSNEGGCPTYSEYESLLDNLQSESIINRTVIDQKMNDLGISLTYTSSLYTSGDYICYSFNWNYWSSSSCEFIYYVDVDIWTTSGILNRSMCSYYKD